MLIMPPVANPRAKGFSLLELVITMAIFGILLALALPGLQQWTTDSQVRNHATYLLSGLQKAKAEAVRHNYTVRFQLVSGMVDACTVVRTGNEWVVSHGDPSLAPGTSPNGGCARTVLPDMIALRDNNDTVAPALQADLDENDLDGNGTAGPSEDVDGDGAFGAVPANTVLPILLAKGFRESQNNVQATITGIDPVTGIANPNISDANQLVCFNGSGQLTRILQGAINNGVCSNSKNPAITERVAFNIDVTDPIAGACVALGGNVRCLRIQVSPTGDVRSCDPALADATDPRRCL